MFLEVADHVSPQVRFNKLHVQSNVGTIVVFRAKNSVRMK